MVSDEEEPGFVDLEFVEIDEETMLSNALSFYEQMDKRRTTRHFSKREVPRELIELAIRTASTAPSGAHLQPWTFVAISNKELKARIREEAEIEEARFYEDRIPEEWEEVLVLLFVLVF